MTEQLKQIIEGAILAADQPLTVDRLCQLFTEDPPARSDVRDALEQISDECEGRGFELKQVASGYRFQVRQELGEWVGRLWEERPPRYSRAMLETLALIAYRQPITRGDIEEIRGVSVSTNIMRSLMEREWVRVVGHRDVPGRPALFATTREFLDYFNLGNLDELPTLSEIRDIQGPTEDLGLDEDVVVRSLDLAQETQEADPADMADLEEVSERVSEIQENIRQFIEEHLPEDELDDELEGEAEAETKTDSEPESDADGEISVEPDGTNQDEADVKPDQPE